MPLKQITVFTSIPEFYETPLKASVLGRAISFGIVSVSLVNLKQYGLGGYKRLDRPSFGGGGMIVCPEVVARCLDDNGVLQDRSEECRLFFTSPRGRLFDQHLAQDLASNSEHIYIFCNRFEGVDQRAIDYYNGEEISIGNYVLCGGETASLVIIESVVRLIEDVLGNKETLIEESFSKKLNYQLEYDHYTKPRVWRGIAVPDELISGNHKLVHQWRMKNSEQKTKK